MSKTIEQAENQVIFYVEDDKIIENDYYSYLKQFGNGDDSSAVEEAEVPVFLVDGKSFKDEDDALEYCNENGLNECDIKEDVLLKYSHVVRYHPNYGRRIKSSQNFDQDREGAEIVYIQGLEWFVSEKNWDAPEYFFSKEDADESRIERKAESMGISKDVLISIESKDLKLKVAREEKEKKQRIERKNNAIFFINNLPDNESFEAKWGSIEMKELSGLSWTDYRNALKVEFPSAWELLKLKFKAKKDILL